MNVVVRSAVEVGRSSLAFGPHTEVIDAWRLTLKGT